MTARLLQHDPALTRSFEKQMRSWELSRSQRTTTPSQPGAQVQDFITISRAVGSGGGEVARLLAEQLGWPVFDKEILQSMAGDDTLRRQIYESMDEIDIGWFEDALRSLMEGAYVRNDYFRRLTETILALARQGRAVFLGRAADLILPRDVGLRVRIIAPLEQRSAQFAQRLNLKSADAEKLMQQIERQRDAFIWNHFRKQATEPTRHDLIINMNSFTPGQAVSVVLQALGLRGERNKAELAKPG